MARSPIYVQLRCRCTHEEGDSDCPVHPTCAECGADISGALVDLRDENERTWPIYDAAMAWAESTRVFPPNGDDDALNYLLETAQGAYNASLERDDGK